MLLNNEWVKNDIREEIKKFLETNENDLTTTQILWDTVKGVLRDKFIVIRAYQKKIETFQIKRERIQINTIRNERGEITTDTTEIQRIVRNCYGEQYAKKF